MARRLTDFHPIHFYSKLFFSHGGKNERSRRRVTQLSSDFSLFPPRKFYPTPRIRIILPHARIPFLLSSLFHIIDWLLVKQSRQSLLLLPLILFASRLEIEACRATLRRPSSRSCGILFYFYSFCPFLVLVMSYLPTAFRYTHFDSIECTALRPMQGYSIAPMEHRIPDGKLFPKQNFC